LDEASIRRAGDVMKPRDANEYQGHSRLKLHQWPSSNQTVGCDWGSLK